MSLTVSIVLGSVRPGRQGLRVAKYLESKLAAAGFAVHVVDPTELKLPLFVGRFAYLPAELKTESLTALQGKFEGSDAFVVVTPEYNHTFSPVISNTLNYFYSEYANKVAGIVTYSVGGFGGVRAAGPLRPFFGELGLVTIPKELPFPVVQNVLHEDGTISPEAGASGESIENGTKQFVNELKWYASALKIARAAGGP
ncbi:hypothetical protein H310_09384 [Aphanomyces invadans]|uniref:NADPH-dependent FMN reductase-like domain-containing protein n=1 Tax=Aphanomyces invadans TaxID=157072 RepID=A0A024TU03_9STRA|nr:hypothetical protein H310_09384 [Aphanomyces invadans]ETV97454.1 hypothetical protein H310_09384 [Aphanomyces invadans]RHY25355.1 hypothetical protein DYB32_008374 [Aphanomyces invadans]|eukprot:XP_008873663.1 hypothetical protein H310_09384 [Aphanomyces invadans]